MRCTAAGPAGGDRRLRHTGSNRSPITTRSSRDKNRADTTTTTTTTGAAAAAAASCRHRHPDQPTRLTRPHAMRNELGIPRTLRQQRLTPLRATTLPDLEHGNP
nr:hypothetical protein GCM10020063_078810 [Dactylosporangium thailandense]